MTTAMIGLPTLVTVPNHETMMAPMKVESAAAAVVAGVAVVVTANRPEPLAAPLRVAALSKAAVPSTGAAGTTAEVTIRVEVVSAVGLLSSLRSSKAAAPVVNVAAWAAPASAIGS